MLFRSREAAARQGGGGLWREAAYGVLDRMRSEAIARRAGTFQIVTLEVELVIQSRGDVRLLARGGGRRGFSVVVQREDRDLQGALGGDLRALQGARIEARGWIVERRDRAGAYEIDASVGGHVRLIERTGEPPARRRTRSGAGTRP